MPDIPELSTERDAQHPTPVAVVPVGTLVALHHTLSGCWGVLDSVTCGCNTETCNVDRVREEAALALEEFTEQLATIPDITLLDLDPEPAQWLAQLKSAVEDHAKAEAAGE